MAIIGIRGAGVLACQSKAGLRPHRTRVSNEEVTGTYGENMMQIPTYVLGCKPAACG
jgi:hypothetical protein